MKVIKIAKIRVSIHVDCLACIIKIIVIPQLDSFSVTALLDGSKLGDMNRESLGSVEEKVRNVRRVDNHHRLGSL
jgi:hypothetical protein